MRVPVGGADERADERAERSSGDGADQGRKRRTSPHELEWRLQQSQSQSTSACADNGAETSAFASSPLLVGEDGVGDRLRNTVAMEHDGVPPPE